MHTMALSLLMASALAAGPDNLALNRPYRLEPAANYRYCTDAGDRTQLTDGRCVQGYFWTQPGTVGWSGRSPVTITIDLGKVQPIAGLSFNTAAGVAGVEFPSAIHVLVSDDARRWRWVADLATLSPAPAADGKYALHRFRAESLATRGQYVKLIVTPSRSYCFVDEIEVLRGPDDLLTRTPQGPGIDDVKGFYRQLLVDTCLRRRLRADAAAVAEGIESAGLDAAAIGTLKAELKAIEGRIPTHPAKADEGFTTVFPIGELHRRLLALQAALWRGRGEGRLVLWQTPSHWDMLSPTQRPGETAPSLDVKMMTGEFRSAAFNITNTADRPRKVHLRIEGLPEGVADACIAVHEGLFTDTQSGVPVCAALPIARGKPSEGIELECLPGLHKQVWLTLGPDLPHGEHAGRIVISETGQAVPLALKVYPVRLMGPGRPRLHLGGWDYTDRERCYEVTPDNRRAFLDALREHFVDSPWAQSAVLDRGRYDAEGNMTAQPDPSQFHAWLDRWPGALNKDNFPGARNYCVFAAVGESFGGHKMGTPAFKRAVSAWITWWAGQLGKWNISPERLHLLLVDEPHNAQMDHVIIEYARAIRSAQTGVRIWEDPTWSDPTKASPELFEVSHVLCPNRPMWLDHREVFDKFYPAQKKAGRRLWLYSCSGPGKLLDPYAYHRLQAWSCWKRGAEGMGFWAFGDSNGSSSWNEYGCTVGAYTPLFLDGKTVTPGKHMEAVREGVQDYEYLALLAERVSQLEKAQPGHPALSDAKALLASAAARVTACMTAGKLIHWREPKDRNLADRVRVEVLEMLMKLGQQ